MVGVELLGGSQYKEKGFTNFYTLDSQTNDCNVCGQMEAQREDVGLGPLLDILDISALDILGAKTLSQLPPLWDR